MKSRFVLTTALGLLAVVLPGPVPLEAVPPPSPPVQGGCPDRHAIGNFQTSNEVTVRFAVDGTTNNYFFAGTQKATSDPGFVAGQTVPGLIQYCVYPADLPSSGTGDYDSWTYGSSRDSFSFKRPHGDPTNVPYDGAEHPIGHASWDFTPPTEHAMLLHVNDPDECAALYGGNPGTCFVYPGLIKSGGGEE